MNAIANSTHERIALLDALRGLAVLGIFFVNIIYFGLPYSAYNFPTLWGGAEQANVLVWAFNNLWVEDAMRGLFVMIFGASAGMLLSEERLVWGGIRSVEIYFRRNMWLMAFGVVHAYLLLSPHDVLYVYGLLGLLVFPLRRVHPLLLSALGMALLCAGAMISANGTPIPHSSKEPPLYQQRATVEEVAEFRHGLLADMEEDVEIYLSGYLEIFNAQKKTVVGAQSTDIYKEHGFALGGMMLIGMALFKWGVLSGLRSRRFYLLLMLGGYGLSLLLRAPAMIDILGSEFDPYTLFNQFTSGRQLSQLPLVLGHVGLVALLSSIASTRRLLQPLRAVGRLALTHYIGQTVFSILFFFGFGLALFGNLERYELVLVCVAVWLVQILFSLWWLKRYRHGPLEWIWRAATRWEVIPLRLALAPLPLVPDDEHAGT